MSANTFLPKTVALVLMLFSRSAFPESLWLEVENVAGKINNPSVMLVDSRAEKDYLSGHIPGAVNLPVNNTFDPGNQFRVVGLSAIQKLFRKAGIEQGKEIIIYDGGGFIDAGRLFWVMEAYGLNQVRVLNGGVPAWKEAGYELNKEETIVTESGFVPMVNPDRVASVFQTKLAILDENTSIIDARSDIEYAGEESKSSRKGHIPSAKSIPWENNFIKKDGRLQLKSVAELRELYSDIEKSAPVVTYCNKGKQSSLTYFILRSLDYDVSHFDGSWHVWGNDPELPVSK
ncbi:hypothetical protein MNBD_GAMMA15-2453 [hydrothermal vent metagenome]|uniref:Rhodanese domain-containing protein n=1 Tax=hydrothermal vent metagenome TaxID=652676 RepID=A0A3B0Y6M9_9ZZZZ